MPGQTWRRLHTSRRGAAFLEYSLLAGLVSAVAIGTITPLGGQVIDLAARGAAGIASAGPEVADDGCLHSTDAPDALMPSAEIDCYRLGDGPDYVFGAAGTGDINIRPPWQPTSVEAERIYGPVDTPKLRPSFEGMSPAVSGRNIILKVNKHGTHEFMRVVVKA